MRSAAGADCRHPTPIVQTNISISTSHATSPHTHSSQQSEAELEEGLPRKYVSYCPEQSPGQPRHSVHRPNTFLRSPGPAAKAAVMSATGLQEL